MRLFIATTFPADVLCALNAVVARVKTRLPPSSWVRPESQHLTFAFLGEQDEAIVPKLGSLVEERLAGIRAFEARLSGCGFFPNSRNARVAWMGFTPAEEFIQVATAVRESVAAAGVELDSVDFKPHLTLCRLRDRWPPACLEIFRSTFGKFESTTFTVDRVTLYSSQLNPKGAIHTPVREFKIA
jgi:RNA 2',3'-cyclic 3'-phosphodiesterase